MCRNRKNRKEDKAGDLGSRHKLRKVLTYDNCLAFPKAYTVLFLQHTS